MTSCLRVLLLFLCLLFPVGGVVAEVLQRHFIVAVDVSGDMRALRDRGLIAQGLPRLLYEGVAEPGQPPMPVFQPGVDRLSLVAFGLTGAAPDACKALTGFDARPEYLFSWQPLSEPSPDRAAFSEALTNWLAEPCRIVDAPSLSPIVSAETLLPIFVAEQLDTPSLYDETLLVVATNEAYNRSPARELAFLARRFQVASTGEARALMEQLSRYFYVDGPEHWTVTLNTFEPEAPLLVGAEGEAVSGFPLVMRMAALRPVSAEVNATLDFPRQLALDRQAMSDHTLRLVDAAGREPVLRLLPAPRFEPVSLKLHYRAADGEDWSLVGETLPAEITVDLTDCGPPRCQQDSDGLRVDLLQVGGIPPQWAANRPLPSPGEIRFRVAFRYRTEGLYEQQRLYSDWQQIDVSVVPPRQINATLLFPRVVLDNPGLAGLWQPGDTGLGQQTAQERLLAWRAAQEPLYMGSAVALLLLLLLLLYLLLYWRAYHRPFQPTLAWLPVAEPTVDFEQLGGQLLLGRLVVENAGRVPWFGRLLGNDAQPRRVADLKLQVKSLESLGLVLHPTPGPALGFIAPSGVCAELQQEITHESQFYVFLDTQAIEDYTPLDGESATLELDFHLDWQRRGQDTRVPLQRSTQLPLQLRRERARPPRVDFQPLPKPPHFQQDETVQVGRFSFESSARRRFARPYRLRFEILARREGGPLREDTVILDDNQIDVAGQQTVEVGVWVLCDGDRVRNPYPLRDDYSFRLVGVFAPGSQPGPHIVRLYRDEAGPAAQILADHRQDG